jgi:hypothetical protein
MPKLVLANPGVRDSVTRPVTLDIVRQLLVWTGLPKDTQIIFPGYDERPPQTGSTISNEKEFNFFDSHSMWKISVEEVHQEDRGLSMAVLYDDNPRIFDDEDARVWIRPAYSPCDVTLRISSRFTDKDQAIRWREDIRTRIAMSRDVRIHDVDYSYLLPLEFIRILEEIYKMREKEDYEPYGQTWDEYLQFYFSPKARLLSNMAGKQTQWGVAEAQARILGYFNFSLMSDENEKKSESSLQGIEFTYTFKYDKPVASVMTYPLVINNQLIDKKYRPTSKLDKVERVEDYALQYTQSAYSLRLFESSAPTENIAMPGISIPEFDEFLPELGTVPPETLRVLTGLTTIDLDNPLELLSLEQLGTHDLNEDVLEFMRTEYQWMTKLGLSIFHLMVYRNEFPLQRDQYTVGSDLMVKLVEPPSLRDTFHVRLSLYQRPSLLPTEAKDRLRNNCTLTRMLLTALRPSLERDGFLPACMVGNYISKKDFDKAAYEIDRYFDTKRTSQQYQFNTVMILFTATS